MFTKAQFVGIFVAAILGLATVGTAENLVVNSGFETMESTSGGSSGSYGDWNGDYSAIVGATSGITPMGGTQMLQFKGTSHNGSGSGNSCEMFQVISISGYESMIASGNAKAQASIYLNRVAGDSQTDTAFGLVLIAYDGSHSTFPSRWEIAGYGSSLCYEVESLSTDNLTGTWQELKVSLDLPANTTFLVLDIYDYEDICNDISYPEFDGHFADNVSLQIIPEPVTICLFGLAGLMFRNKK